MTRPAAVPSLRSARGYRQTVRRRHAVPKVRVESPQGCSPPDLEFCEGSQERASDSSELSRRTRSSASRESTWLDSRSRRGTTRESSASSSPSTPKSRTATRSWRRSERLLSVGAISPRLRSFWRRRSRSGDPALASERPRELTLPAPEPGAGARALRAVPRPRPRSARGAGARRKAQGRASFEIDRTTELLSEVRGSHRTRCRR